MRSAADPLYIIHFIEIISTVALAITVFCLLLMVLLYAGQKKELCIAYQHIMNTTILPALLFYYYRSSIVIIILYTVQV